MRNQLRRLAGRIPQEQEQHVEPSATHHDSGTEHPGSEQTRDRADAGNLPSDGAQSRCGRTPPRCRRLHRAEKAEPYRQQILELFSTCKGNLVRVHEELLAGGAALVVSGADRLLPPAWHRASARRGRRASTTSSRARRCSTTPLRTRSNWPARSARCRPPRRCCATRGCCSSSATRRFSVSTARCFSPTRCATSPARAARVMIDNTHVVVLRGTGREMVPVPEMAAFARALRVSVRGA